MEFDPFADTFARDSRLQVTIIDVAGVLLCGSRFSLLKVRQNKNHADRQEIKEARDRGVGISLLHNATLGIDLLYVAAQNKNIARQGYTRIALPLDKLHRDG